LICRKVGRGRGGESQSYKGDSEATNGSIDLNEIDGPMIFLKTNVRIFK
jgi:hypothetical protein